METLRARIMRHEGMRLKPYKDSVGKLTIGCGRNLDDVGISEAEANMMLDNDILKARRAITENMLWATQMDNARYGVLLEMVFQIGIGGVLKFKNTLAAMKRGDYTAAAAGMLDSLWAKQTPARATELAKIMATGEENGK